MSKKVYKVDYLLTTRVSFIDIRFKHMSSYEGFNIREKLIHELKSVGFLGCGITQFNARIDTLNMPKMKSILCQYTLNEVVLEITILLSYSDIVRLYPGTLDTIKDAYNILSLTRDDDYNKKALFYFEIHSSNITELLDKFDITGCEFETYYIGSKFRIAVRNETDLKKMKLIGLIEFFKSGYNRASYCVIVMDSLMDRLPWKL